MPPTRRAVALATLSAPLLLAAGDGGPAPRLACTASAGDGAEAVARALCAVLGLPEPLLLPTPRAAAEAVSGGACSLLLLGGAPPPGTGLARCARLGRVALILAVRPEHGATRLHEFLDWVSWRREPPPFAAPAACPRAADLAWRLGGFPRAAPDAAAAWRSCGGLAVAALLRPHALGPELLAGRARALAASAAARLRALSAIETFAENGLAGLTAEDHLALHAASPERAAGVAEALRPRLARGWETVAAALRAVAAEPEAALA